MCGSTGEVEGRVGGQVGGEGRTVLEATMIIMILKEKMRPTPRATLERVHCSGWVCPGMTR